MKRNVWIYRVFFASVCLLFIPLLDRGLFIFNPLSSDLLPISIAFITALFIIEKISDSFLLEPFAIAVACIVISSISATTLPVLIKTVMPTSLPIDNIVLVTFLITLYATLIVAAQMKKKYALAPKLLEGKYSNKGQELLVDQTALEDPRLIELAKTGFLSHKLLIPSFILKEIETLSETHEDAIKTRAKKCNDHIKRLQAIGSINLEIVDYGYSRDETSLFFSKIAKSTHCPILTADQSQYPLNDPSLLVVCLENIASILKPVAQRGEILLMKVQRLGKEPKQGVGYLDDGTMVVINGGGEYLGQSIKTQVLSQKYSSSGKIIFCNALPQNISTANNGCDFIDLACHQKAPF